MAVISTENWERLFKSVNPFSNTRKNLEASCNPTTFASSCYYYLAVMVSYPEIDLICTSPLMKRFYLGWAREFISSCFEILMEHYWTMPQHHCVYEIDLFCWKQESFHAHANLFTMEMLIDILEREISSIEKKSAEQLADAAKKIHRLLIIREKQLDQYIKVRRSRLEERLEFIHNRRQEVNKDHLLYEHFCGPERDFLKDKLLPALEKLMEKIKTAQKITDTLSSVLEKHSNYSDLHNLSMFAPTRVPTDPEYPHTMEGQSFIGQKQN